MIQKFFLFVGIASVIVLGIVIFLPSGGDIGPVDLPEEAPAVQLEFFLADKMDYGVKFSRILAERRIERARRFAKEDPALEVRAREVIDTLEARLARQAKM